MLQVAADKPHYAPSQPHQLGAITAQSVSMVGCMDGWMDGWMDCAVRCGSCVSVSRCTCFLANGLFKDIAQILAARQGHEQQQRRPEGSHANPLEHLTDHIGPGQLEFLALFKCIAFFFSCLPP